MNYGRLHKFPIFDTSYYVANFFANHSFPLRASVRRLAQWFSAVRKQRPLWILGEQNNSLGDSTKLCHILSLYLLLSMFDFNARLLFASIVGFQGTQELRQSKPKTPLNEIGHQASKSSEFA